MQSGGNEIQRQKLPQEPQRPVRPERQRTQAVPIGGDARIGRGQTVGRINRRRNDHGDAEGKRQTEPQGAVAQETPALLARQARPDKQAGKKKHQRHQIDVLPGAEEIEAEEAMAVDDRERAPIVGRAVESGTGYRYPVEVGQHRMESEHDQDHNTAQIGQRQTGARTGTRHGIDAPHVSNPELK